MRLLSTVVACMLVGACGGADGPTVIDGSSQAAYEESLKQARRDVGPGDRIKLAAAITEYQAQMFAKADNRSEYQRLVREGMHGLTAPAIVAQFDKDVKRVNGQAADDLRRQARTQGTLTPIRHAVQTACKALRRSPPGLPLRQQADA